ncbi:pentatricopeptide repeat-containing protein At4g32450, mitochondrial-like [Andrographis paniculata]|uniref:pentatricopeptide repeat-containing protein At4g32450, mitochondrial-like n=1 Tax=Andrographis paniculata TaxID=175694 RepID=UPI0021E9091B|nr:pentatricopeptide repeat-containing protein At4g32450, mitochondrial-like [Andrographis paniculata]
MIAARAAPQYFKFLHRLRASATPQFSSPLIARYLGTTLAQTSDPSYEYRRVDEDSTSYNHNDRDGNTQLGDSPAHRSSALHSGNMHRNQNVKDRFQGSNGGNGQHNVNSIFSGRGDGGTFGMPPRNHGAVELQNSVGQFAPQTYVPYSSVPSDVKLTVEQAETPVQTTTSSLQHLDEFIRQGKLKEAVEQLGRLHGEGVEVDLPRYMMLIKACGDKEDLDAAKAVHEHLLKSTLHLEVRSFNRILKMYSDCGSMEDAFKVFDEMPKRNLTSWDNMITGLAKNDLGEEAIELFTEFKTSGLKPDGQMFIGVFSACGVVCDIVEGMLHFESMTKGYGIIPTMEHYVSIVDMMGNAGWLDEALEFIEKMPLEPTVGIWETLMKFSRIHGNKELGDRCLELIDLLDASHCNEQSRAGLVTLKPCDIVGERENKKGNSVNLLDTTRGAHEYRAGDRSHPNHERLYELLWVLKQHMKEAGYVPDIRFILHDVDPEMKEEALMGHSERLAAAQGLLTSPARSSMRIIKNLRVCCDCHNVFKIMSKIVGRAIIMRDSKRFHHFEDGRCNCNDYW